MASVLIFPHTMNFVILWSFWPVRIEAERPKTKWPQTPSFPRISKNILFSNLSLLIEWVGDIWSDDYPLAIVKAPWHLQKLTAWSTLWAEGIIGGQNSEFFTSLSEIEISLFPIITLSYHVLSLKIIVLYYVILSTIFIFWRW